jgi:hypothetical protein
MLIMTSPGPSEFNCCSEMTDSGYGGYSDPTLPSVGCCDATSVSGAGTIVAAWPGSVREIGCCRDCDDPTDSDHCVGKAIDLMISDAGGSATLAGNAIAEWAMNNADSMDVKYVIWGQRIWESDTSVRHWSEWDPMEDRESITQNHWDHVHVSFN